jgi:hypothetical protein
MSICEGLGLDFTEIWTRTRDERTEISQKNLENRIVGANEVIETDDDFDLGDEKGTAFQFVKGQIIELMDEMTITDLVLLLKFAMNLNRDEAAEEELTRSRHTPQPDRVVVVSKHGQS